MERSDPDNIDHYDSKFHIFEKVKNKEGKEITINEIDEESLALTLEKLFEQFSEFKECKHCNHTFINERLFLDSCSDCYINLKILKCPTFECFVCKEDCLMKNNKVKYCTNNHTDMMCKRCYNKLTECPLCRENFEDSDED